jgi:hypothetical protein
MLQLLLQATPHQAAGGAAAGGAVAVLASFWCCAAVLGAGQFVIFLVALIQVLQRNMPGADKLLWAAVCWFLPLIGPILWWTIGAKQHPQNPTGGPFPGPPR